MGYQGASFPAAVEPDHLLDASAVPEILKFRQRLEIVARHEPETHLEGLRLVEILSKVDEPYLGSLLTELGLMIDGWSAMNEDERRETLAWLIAEAGERAEVERESVAMEPGFYARML